MQAMEIHTHSAEELQEAARDFVTHLSPRDSAMVVTLSGDLGAGKTTFVQGVARALGITETVSSPTFVLEKMYALENQVFRRLVHIDAYRLNGTHELEVLGWWELLADSGNLIILEWPEKVAAGIPENAINLRFDFEGEGRIITSTYGEKESSDETSS
jgi:tRNA threonylcarbamoyladenosine biosynthesis protein TsaE